jgi:cytidylate kinase
MARDIAEKVAEKLGYECISREILLEASDKYDVSKDKLEKALWESPSLLDKLTHEKALYVFYIQSMLVKQVAKDNVVYHGIAGHFFLKKVSHVLKVRVIAEIEKRVEVLAGLEHITKAKARAKIKKIDKNRRKWAKHLYRADPCDPLLYDIMIKVHKFDINAAVELICNSISQECFKPTPESKIRMNDLVTACECKAALIESWPDIFVACDYGNVLIYSNTSESGVRKIKEAADAFAAAKESVNSVEIHNKVSPSYSAL